MVRDMIEKNEKVSPNADLLEKLKSLIPGAFAKDGSIDADAIRYWAEQAVGDPQLVTEERETFNFLGKDYARLLYALDTETVIVPDEENNEKPENKNSENLYLSGDNLEVLKHLRRSYEGQIKCIYIDPPYNTGSDDFVYNDSFDFSEKDLEEKLGLNSERIEKIMKMRKRGSHSHAAWLTFMYPRLKLARDLLKDDGVIFISIDDNEQANLKILCDEIFGEENFVGDIIWNSTKSVTNTALISVAHTHNLTYFKNSSYFIENRTDFRLIDDGSGFENPDNDPKGAWKADPYQVGGWRPNQQYEITNPNTGKVYKPAPGCSWKNDKSKFIELWNDGRIIFGKDGKSEPKRKRYIWEAQERGCVSTTLWNDIDTTTNATKYLKTLFDGKTVFSNPKPVSLIHKFLELGCNTKNNEKCIVVDFFSGSGTTAETVLQISAEANKNKTFIMVQIPTNLDALNIKNSSKNNQYAVDAISILDTIHKPHTLDQIGMERIRRAAAKIKQEHPESQCDFGFKHFTIQKPNEKSLDAIKNFEPNPNFGESTILKQFGSDTVLTTWMVNDGHKFNADVEKINLNDYIAYKVNDYLYLIDSGINEKHLKDLFKKYDEDKNFKPKHIVLFGYSFGITALDTLKANIKGIDSIDIHLEIRY